MSPENKKPTAEADSGTLVFSAESPKKAGGNKNFRRLGIILLCVLLLGIIAWGVMQKKTDDKTVEACSDESDGSLLSDAREALEPSNPDRLNQLTAVAEKIKQTEDHENDANCLFPIVSYYILLSDIPHAEEYYAKLEKTGGQEFKGKYGTPTTRSELKASIQHLKEVQENLAKSTIMLGAPVTQESQ